LPAPHSRHVPIIIAILYSSRAHVRVMTPRFRFPFPHTRVRRIGKKDIALALSSGGALKIIDFIKLFDSSPASNIPCDNVVVENASLQGSCYADP
jgi:hypothetical protein